MVKVEKYCSSCDEGFAEKFGFCPICAAPLKAVEMNPLANGAVDAEPVPQTPLMIANDEVIPRHLSGKMSVHNDQFIDAGTPKHSANVDDQVFEPSDLIGAPSATVAASGVPAYNSDLIEAPSNVVTPTVAASTVPAYNFESDVSSFDEKPLHDPQPSAYKREDDGGYYVTEIQDQNGNQRNLLLLGSTFLVLTVALSATVISLFQKDLGIGAIGDDRSIASLIEEVPMVVDEEPKKEEKEKGGGGGGGGDKDKEETSQGDLADQQKNPVRPPDAKVFRSDNFELKTPTPSTQGDRKFEKKFNQWGDPNSRFAGLSNGTGSGGGQGSGTGTGQGSGNGTGAGSGSGSGSGGGTGSGNGDGDGPGSGTTDRPPPRIPVGVTTAVKIISKPQAKYNDAGRTNGVQGSVRLKITLLANGSVGSITPVTRLPHGLTEQAIAAARQLRFEPKKVNGIPQATIVTIDYSFSIY